MLQYCILFLSRKTLINCTHSLEERQFLKVYFNTVMKSYTNVVNRKHKEIIEFFSAGGISKGTYQPEMNTVLKWLSDSQVSLERGSSVMSAIVCTDIAVIETYVLLLESSLYHTKRTKIQVQHRCIWVALDYEKATIIVISYPLQNKVWLRINLTSLPFVYTSDEHYNSVHNEENPWFSWKHCIVLPR